MKKNITISKAICFALIAVMMFSVAGCGQESNKASEQTVEKSIEATTTEAAAQTTQEAVKEEKPLYQIKVLQNLGIYSKMTTKTSDEMEIGKFIKEKFNIVFEFIPYSGDYREKLNLMLAAGDYPELLRVEREDIVTSYIDAGAAVALDEYLPNSPNFTERYKGIIPYWKMPAKDGKLYKWEYQVPNEIRAVMETNDLLVRTDALEKQGWPKLISCEDYLDFFRKSLKDIPETLGNKTIGMVAPLAEPWGMQGIVPIMYDKGGRYSMSAGNEGVLWNQVDQKFEHYFSNEYVKESLQFFNRMYRDGILDKDAFTDFQPQMEAKIKNGQALSVWFTTWQANGANQSMIKAGHPEIQYITQPIRTSTQVQRNEKRQIRLEETRPFDSVIITKNAKDPKRIMELIDWAASEEGQILLQSGIEGTHYKRVDGKRVPTDELIAAVKSDPDYNQFQGFRSFMFLGYCNQVAEDGQCYSLTADPEFKDEIFLTDGQKNAFKMLGWKTSVDYWLETAVAAPSGQVASIMIDSSSDLGTIHQKMVELRVKTSSKLIMAKTDGDFESIWKNAMTEYEKLDPQRIVDKYNELLQVAKSKVKK